MRGGGGGPHAIVPAASGAAPAPFSSMMADGRERGAGATGRSVKLALRKLGDTAPCSLASAERRSVIVVAASVAFSHRSCPSQIPADWNAPKCSGAS